MAEITLAQLTEITPNGAGVFDSLMRACKEHLDIEFNKQRIKGPEYSEVYLGQLQSVLQTSVNFLFQREKVGLEAQLLELQITLAGVEVQKANAQLAILEQQVLTAAVERDLMTTQKLKVLAEIDLVREQIANSLIEKVLIEANANKADAETVKVTAETLNVPKQGLLIEANTAQVTAQKELAIQEKANAIIQGTVLVAQECKLRAEFDLTEQSTLKSAAETTLLTQKVITERAQVTGLGVDADSVVGRQKALYFAQTEGFKRDAEQKAAKLYIDVWSARRMTDDATQANTTNKLDEATTGSVMTKLLAGINV